MEQLKTPVLSLPDDITWSINLILKSNDYVLRYRLISEINGSLYADIRVYLILLGTIGINYKFSLSNIKDNQYNIDSIDLSYWIKVLHNKLNIKNKIEKPKITTECIDIKPFKIEVASESEIIEIFDIN